MTSIKICLHSLWTAVKVVNIAQSVVPHWQLLISHHLYVRCVPDQETISQLQCQDRIHTDAWCICWSQCCKRSSSDFCMPSPSPLHRLATQHSDERFKRKQSESFLSQPEHIIWVSRHGTLSTLYLRLGVFLWKQYIIIANYKDFCKFLIMYSFTHTNIVFLLRHLPTEIVIFINVCYQMECFSGDSFSLFRSRFC